MSDEERKRASAARVEARIAAIRPAWPAELGLGPPATSFLGRLSDHLAPAFPALPGDAALDLAVFCALYVQLVLDQDALLDGQCAPDQVGPTAMRMLALQTECDVLLRGLLPPGSPFWGQLHRYVADHAHTYAIERSFREGRQPLSALSEDVALRLAGDKVGLARIVVSAMAALTGAADVVEPLTEAIACVGEAKGMRDDLRDWREDLRNRQPSLVLARALGEWPTEPDVARVGRAIHLGGHSRYVLALAVESLDEADRLLTGFPPMSWFACTAQLRRASLAELIELDRALGDRPAPGLRTAP